MAENFIANLHFADDVNMLSRNTSEAETMLEELNERNARGTQRSRKKDGPRKKQDEDPTDEKFMPRRQQIELDGSPITEATLYVNLGRSTSIGSTM
ncbi:hypothetical protein KIN20_012733 [Parelaphostrongylus tenuis]|uniref:Reverse transcriptase domain-containing protein n=1 Tax=Parelaphostrongylus tenuis TaxID=148309 RepID=A0AAD5MTQ6_PARTN|nr:hypothetical protein KIN20_012733 [Parelaphostrongylus tenuis]